MGLIGEMRLILSELSQMYIELRIKIYYNISEPLLTGIQCHKPCLSVTMFYNMPRKKYCVTNYYKKHQRGVVVLRYLIYQNYVKFWCGR